MDPITQQLVMGAAGVSTGETLDSTTIGDSANGGYFAGYISHTQDGNATHALIVGPNSIGFGSYHGDGTVPLASTNTLTTATSEYDGVSNTAIMVANLTGGGVSHINGLSHAGFTDWYIPARYELEIAYYNLKPSTSGNHTSYGGNAYAVPARSSNYTSTVPSQTSVSAFQSGGSEAFASNTAQISHYYWTSTQYSSSNASHWYKSFHDGREGSTGKNYAGASSAGSLTVRPFRRIEL